MLGRYEQGFVLVLCQDLVVGFQAVSAKNRGVKKKGISPFTGNMNQKKPTILFKKEIQLLGGYTNNNNVNNADKHCRERCGCHTGCYLIRKLCFYVIIRPLYQQERIKESLCKSFFSK